MSKPIQARGADRRRFHYLYKVTCKVTGRYYIGMHSTDDMDDGYMGSGKRLWQSFKKHGIEQHVKEVLEQLPSREALRLREEQVVSDELIDDPMCMNLALGGEGGWDHVNAVLRRRIGHHSRAGYAGYIASIKSGKRCTTNLKHVDRAALKLAKRGYFQPSIQVRAVAAAKHPDVIAKRKLTYARIGHQSGEKNSSYGTRWINRDGVSQRVRGIEAYRLLEHGWLLGKRSSIKPPKSSKPSAADRWKAWCDERCIELLAEFDQHRSISRLLHDRGFQGRDGNGYVSDWLKANDRQIVRRRNS